MIVLKPHSAIIQWPRLAREAWTHGINVPQQKEQHKEHSRLSN
jgi:hypothetical protein